MPRPAKCRRVCQFPTVRAFIPEGVTEPGEAIVLQVDEYEALRLIDREGLSQEQCGQRMQIARTSVQRIYESGRRKLADCLVEGRPLRIQGGDFRLCDGRAGSCGHSGCLKYRYHQTEQKTEKGEHIMRVAVTYENGQVFPHFGHTQAFKVYDIADNAVVSSQVVDTNGSGHGALAGVLNALNADVLICGGIGGGAQAALTAAGIRWYGGVSGEADAAVAALLAGELAYDPEAKCDHHAHGGDHTCGGHGDGHTCSDHGCGGEHTCGGHH